MPPSLRLLLPATLLTGCVASEPAQGEGDAPVPASTAPTPPLMGGPQAAGHAPALSRILAQITVDRRQFAASAPGVLSARIPGVLTAELSADGLRAQHAGDTVTLRTARVQDEALEGAEPALGACAPTSEWVGPRCAPAAEVAHGSLTEWWTSGPDGVRQGWTLPQPVDADDELRLTLALDEGEVIDVDADGRGATLQGSTGALWRYEELLAWDAAGTPLTARVEIVGPALELVVDTAGAAWPVTVDPVLRPVMIDETRITASDGAADDVFGYAVAVAGDLDGDGYDDVVVGAYHDDDAGRSSGSVYVYYGSASGLDSSSEVKLVASDAAAFDYYGLSVAGAGDLDGDGYDDLVVGAYGVDDTASGAGAAYVYYGSATGLLAASEQKLQASDTTTSQAFGYAVRGAGDLDDDGFDDLIVGAPKDADGGTEAGAVYIYYGASTGVLADSEQKLVASDADADDWYGGALVAAGDLDGDGYDDVAVGALYDEASATDGGSVYIYYGSSAGLVSSSETRLLSSNPSDTSYYGRALAGRGDLDDDGYDDLVIGAALDDSRETNGGAVYVHYGSASGVAATADAVLYGSERAASDVFGGSLALGDIDEDGVDDLIVGATGVDEAASGAGAIYVFFGSDAGVGLSGELLLTTTSAASGDALGVAVAAGDVDGDGRADIIGGASGDDDRGANSGSITEWRTSTKLMASGAARYAQLGYDVASAGDVNGDGYADVIIGAYGDDYGGVADPGTAYVYLGSATGLQVTSETRLGPSDGAPDDWFGAAVASAGDVDGDGYDDVIVGAPRQDESGSRSGAAYLYMGSASGVSASSEVKLTASDAAGGDEFGYDLVGAGDLDADGYADVVIGAYLDDDRGGGSGSVYVYYGSSTGLGSEQKVTSSDGAAGDWFGGAVSGGGDIDGDGYDDVIVGANRADAAGANSGAAYVFYGSATGLDAGSEQKVVASDGRAEDGFSRKLAMGGDIDGDGYDDIAVGADIEGGVGAVYVFRGSDTGIVPGSEQRIGPADTTYSGAFGRAVAIADDLDGDGYSDLFVGDFLADHFGIETGAAYVYFGSDAGIVTDTEQELLAYDAGPGEDFGFSVAHAGDIDGDGFSDLLVGAYLDHEADDVTGAVYVYGGGCRDLDGDGYCSTDDCDDLDADAHPNATEIVGDGVDQDCDGGEICYVDTDDDGFPVSTTVTSSDADCSDAGEGTADQLADAGTDDCDDADASVFPGATEGVGDEVDQDCDGGEICYADADDDGYTDGTTTVPSSDTDCSESGEGLASDPTGDCDNDDATVNPGATETVGDEVDQDCDGTELCYVDADEDGYTDGATTVVSTDTRCTDAGEGLATDPTGECDDADASVHPGATELTGDEVDQDCDGLELCYVDADDDGYTDGGSTVTSADADCSDAGEGTSTDPTGECDDTDPSVYPGATDAVGDEVDSDCDGIELCFVDADADGVTVAGATVESTDDTDCADLGEGLATDPTGDCDDADASIHPGAVEVAGDEVDSDCDGVEYCLSDEDGDGYTDGSITVASDDIDCEGEGEGLAIDPTGDCDDMDAGIHPGARELTGDGVDSNCDGAEVCYADADGDGFGDGSIAVSSDADCDDPGEVGADAPMTDCDDDDGGVHPGATEVCDDEDVDEDCDGLADDADDSVATSSLSTFYDDADGDGYGDALTAQAGCDAPSGTVADNRDCDDSDAEVHPGAEEVADDGIDQDCDGADAEGTPPVDEDGGADGDEDDADKVGGCSALSGTGAPASLFLFGMVGLLWRRRSPLSPVIS